MPALWETLTERSLFGNPLSAYLVAVGMLLGGFIAVYIFRFLILRQAERWAARTQTHVDDFLTTVLSRTLTPILYFGVVYLSLRSLSLNPSIAKAVTFVGVLLVTVCAVRFLLEVLRFIIFKVWIPRQKEATNLERQTKALMPIVTGIIWALGGLFLIDNLGFKVSAIVAGLGIGGVAVALASQTVLADLFSYFAIMFDRPFEIDDFIIVGEYMGTIEHIGIKTTRIRSLGGEQIVFSNKDLTDSRVSNYKRMELRRVVFKLGVTYDTPVDKLKRATEFIKALIHRTPDTRLDRVHFASYGDFNLIIEVVYFVLSADYNKYMDIQQELNLAIKEEFEKEGIDFALSNQKIQLADVPPWKPTTATQS